MPNNTPPVNDNIDANGLDLRLDPRYAHYDPELAKAMAAGPDLVFQSAPSLDLRAKLKAQIITQLAVQHAGDEQAVRSLLSDYPKLMSAWGDIADWIIEEASK